MKQGVVVKSYSSFYYVRTETGEEVACRLRGKFKQGRFSLLVGDRVSFAEVPEDGTGAIEEILPRRNALRRPPVANVDQVLLVFAATTPAPNPVLIDRFLVLCEHAGITPVLCFNKADDEEAAASLEALHQLYAVQVGYRVLLVSARSGRGLEQLTACLRGKISAFAGPSGVGKSTLLNRLCPSFSLETGGLSRKIGRGRHTTRFATLLPLEGMEGYVVDTPGFSQTDFSQVGERELGGCFPEMQPCLRQCRFTGCLHLAEPDCAVKEAVAAGRIAPSRYESYQEILGQIREARKGY